jgi:hypothetical protein
MEFTLMTPPDIVALLLNLAMRLPMVTLAALNFNVPPYISSWRLTAVVPAPYVKVAPSPTLRGKVPGTPSPMKLKEKTEKMTNT